MDKTLNFEVDGQQQQNRNLCPSWARTYLNLTVGDLCIWVVVFCLFVFLDHCVYDLGTVVYGNPRRSAVSKTKLRRHIFPILMFLTNTKALDLHLHYFYELADGITA